MQVDRRYLLSREVRESLHDRKSFSSKLAKGQTMQQILKFSDDAMLGFYHAAGRLLDEKKYGDSADAFFFLTQLAPQVTAFWLGLARSERLNNHLDQAIPLYVTAIAIEGGDKEVYLECVRCCLAAGKKEEAIQILDMALTYCDEHPEFSDGQDLHDTSLRCKEWIAVQ